IPGHLVATDYCQRSAFTEVVLHINNDQGRSHMPSNRTHRSFGRKATGRSNGLDRPVETRNACAYAPSFALSRSGISLMRSATATPAASRASILPLAVPDPPEIMAPAWPIRLPGGAVRPAMKPAIGLVTLALM